MDPEVPEISPSQGARLQDVIAGSPGIVLKLKRAGVFALKLALGAFFCTGFLGWFGVLGIAGPIVVVGWTYRLAQRTALKVWWQRSPEWYEGVRFETLASTNDDLRQHLRWPNWLRGGRRLGSLDENFKVGFAGVLNSYVLMLIPGIVWALTWGGGWNVSFHSLYEQAFVHTSRYIFAMLAFAAAMFYLPMAQARQAVTGDWRSFYDFRAVRKLVRRRWFGSLVLAVLYAIISIPVAALTFIPYFIGKDDEAFIDLPAMEILPILHRYMFAACLFVFPAYVFLRLVAARLYASAVREALQEREIEPVGFEKVAVEKLHIAVPEPARGRSAPTRFILWTGSLSGRVTSAILVLLVWLAFSFQIVVGQFFKYETDALKGWINQPLVQMPWFDLVPTELRKEARRERQGGCQD